MILVLNSSGKWYDLRDDLGNTIARFDDLGAAGSALRFLNLVQMNNEQEQRAIRALDNAAKNTPISL